MQLTTACLVAFAGFLRFSELIQLKTSDISIREDAMVIKIPHSKTDQLRKGDEVIIARSGKATCPVTYLGELFEKVWYIAAGAEICVPFYMQVQNG